MIKELISIANLLDKKGFLREADELDLIINKLARTDEDLEFRDNKVPKHEGFIWPWDIWNSLSPAIRNDMHETLSNLALIPLLGMGPASADFLLNIFEGEYKEAAIKAIFIILQISMAKYFGKPVINLFKRGSEVKQVCYFTAKYIKDYEIKDFAIDIFLSLCEESINKVCDVLLNSRSIELNNVGTEITNLNQEIISEINLQFSKM